MATCEKYLDFEPTEIPKWRLRLKEYDSRKVPTISQMISKIQMYRKKYVRALSKNKIDMEKKDKADRELLIKFLLTVQEEEEIGVQAAGKTSEIIMLIDAEIDENSSVDSGSCQDSTDVEVHSKRNKFSTLGNSGKSTSFELPCYPSLVNTKNEITSSYKSTSHTSKPTMEEQETGNLYRGYKHIAKEVFQIKMEEEDTRIYLGLMDVETFILQTHKILMYEIMDDYHTGPGKFSTNERQAFFNGVRHVYPHFATEESALAAVLMLVDRYNEMIDEIGKIPDSGEYKEETLKLSFKCAAVFLAGFLTLHPFGDGNGRLARLLCSYSLQTFSPFLTPIFNVFSSAGEKDYVQALVVAGKGIQVPQNINAEDEAKRVTDIVLNQKPSDLCALIIESNWSMWRHFLHKLGIKNIKPYKWETGY